MYGKLLNQLTELGTWQRELRRSNNWRRLLVCHRGEFSAPSTIQLTHRFPANWWAAFNFRKPHIVDFTAINLTSAFDIVFWKFGPFRRVRGPFDEPFTLSGSSRGFLLTHSLLRSRPFLVYSIHILHSRPFVSSFFFFLILSETLRYWMDPISFRRQSLSCWKLSPRLL